VVATRQGVCEAAFAELFSYRIKQTRGDVHKVQTATPPGEEFGVVDAYSGYHHFYKEPEHGILEVACWALQAALF